MGTYQYFMVCSSSHNPSSFLRTKLDETPIPHRLCTDFAPTLVRRKSEGTQEDERREMGGTSWPQFSFLHITYTKQHNKAIITNCKHFHIFTLQFITKTRFIQNKISYPRFIYLLFVIFYCIFIAFCLTLHPISRHIESKKHSKLNTNKRENKQKL